MPRGRSRHDPSRPPPEGPPRLAALRLLGRRDYTAFELTTRLVERGYPPDEVRAAIDALTADGAVDDSRAAFAHVRTSARIKGRGRLRIIRELEARGIAAGVIRDAIAQLSPDDDRAAIERLLARRGLPRPLQPDDRRRLFQHLLRRGFPSAAISAALAFTPDDE